MSCSATHPDSGASCILGGVHKNHVCRPGDGGVVQWPNTDYVDVPAKRKWTPKPPRKLTILEQRELQRKANDYASQETARIEGTDPAKLARRDGSITSEKAAEVASYRSKSQKSMLLVEYVRCGDGGLTDEEAAERAGLLQRPRCCWWHRCGDLVEDGMIEPIEEVRILSTGMEGRVCVPTEQGRQVALRLMGES